MLKTLQTKDLNHFMSLYADDASFFPVEEPIATGKQSIRATWARYLAIPGFNSPGWQITKVEVSRSGDLAYVQGSYETSLEDLHGKPVIERGKWVDVWRKQSDRAWQIVADISNTDSEPPTHKPPQAHAGMEELADAADSKSAGA